MAPLIYMVAGEASGDQIGARLMSALKDQTNGKVRFAGVGGDLMIREGLTSLFPMSDLSIMGFTEIIPHIPNVLNRLAQTTRHILKLRPQVVVTIDSPGFNFRLAKRLQGTGIPVIHYTAPSVWAWRPGRAKKIAPILSHLLALFPFEPPYFEKVGLPCTFVGHPLVEKKIDQADGAAFLKKHRISDKETLICLLPGSRGQEIKTLFPIFGRTLEKLRASHKSLKVVLPASAKNRRLIEELSARGGLGQDIPVIWVESEHEKFQAMGASQAALAASGTVTLELALAGTPMVVAYKVNKLSEWILRRLILVPWVCLVNILANRAVAPELLQDECRPDRLADALEKILKGPERDAQRKAFQEIATSLQGEKGSPSAHAAKIILKSLDSYENSDIS